MPPAATPKRVRDSGQRRGLAPVAAAAARVAAPLLKKRGLAEARIVTDWRAIVGATVAERSAPERLVRGRGAESGGTLRLRVALQESELAAVNPGVIMTPALYETLTDWVGRSTALLEPLAAAIGRHVLRGDAIFADDTPVKMQACMQQLKR